MALGAVISPERVAPAFDQEESPMSQPRPDAAPPASEGAGAPAPETLLEEDLLVEDVSIDGMCGVY